jgi:hypothetical protein
MQLLWPEMIESNLQQKARRNKVFSLISMGEDPLIRHLVHDFVPAH